VRVLEQTQAQTQAKILSVAQRNRPARLVTGSVTEIGGRDFLTLVLPIGNSNEIRERTTTTALEGACPSIGGPSDLLQVFHSLSHFREPRGSAVQNTFSASLTNARSGLFPITSFSSIYLRSKSTEPARALVQCVALAVPTLGDYPSFRNKLGGNCLFSFHMIVSKYRRHSTFCYPDTRPI
jgi:hypothetical protein